MKIGKKKKKKIGKKWWSVKKIGKKVWSVKKKNRQKILVT